jgi:hypothetical protein
LDGRAGAVSDGVKVLPDPSNGLRLVSAVAALNGMVSLDKRRDSDEYLAAIGRKSKDPDEETGLRLVGESVRVRVLVVSGRLSVGDEAEGGSNADAKVVFSLMSS